MTTDTTEMAETTVSPILMDHALKGPPQGRWTIVNWDRLPDDGNRYEIIAGKLYMSTAPSTFHQWIVGAFIEQLGVSLRYAANTGNHKAVYPPASPERGPPPAPDRAAGRGPAR